MMLLRRGTLQGLGEDMNYTEFSAASIAMGSGNTSTTTTVTAVDLTKAAILLLSVQGDADTASSSALSMIRASFDNSTTVRFTRGATGVGLNYNFAVVNFPKAVSVRFYSVSVPNASTSQAITSVNAATSFIFGFETSGDGVSSVMDCRAVITNDTTVDITRGAATGAAVCSFWVVELS